MTASALIFMGMSFTRPRSERIFHYITAAIVFTAAIAYFSMGANLGQVPILVEFPDSRYGGVGSGTREIFYVRYIDW
jgi:bacteriorhodopsin